MVTHEDFEVFLHDMQEQTIEVLGRKATEYAEGTIDRMHNFEISKILQGLVDVNTIESAAWNLMSKQLASIIDMINNPGKSYDTWMIKEKIGDSINYLLLIGAMLEDRCIINREIEDGLVHKKRNK